MSEYRHENSDENTRDYKKSAQSDFSVERLNELFYNQNITSQEHSYLLDKVYPIEKKVSVFAWLCLSCAVIAWLSMMRFNHRGAKYELMSADYSLYVASFLTTTALVFYYLSYREIHKKRRLAGSNIALIGLTLTIAELTVTVPTWLMHLHSKLFEIILWFTGGFPYHVQ